MEKNYRLAQGSYCKNLSYLSIADCSSGRLARRRLDEPGPRQRRVIERGEREGHVGVLTSGEVVQWRPGFWTGAAAALSSCNSGALAVIGAQQWWHRCISASRSLRWHLFSSFASGRGESHEGGPTVPGFVKLLQAAVLALLGRGARAEWGFGVRAIYRAHGIGLAWRGSQGWPVAARAEAGLERVVLGHDQSLGMAARPHATERENQREGRETGPSEEKKADVNWASRMEKGREGDWAGAKEKK